MYLRLLAPVAAFAALTAAASAAELNLVGNTTGSAFTFTQNAGGLSYQAGRFDTTTIGGAYSLGSDDLANNSLGRFVLKSTPGTYAGGFSLVVNFTAPTGITPSSTAIYSAVLSGTLTTTGSSVRVDFDNAPKTFSFSNNGQQGSFSLYVNDLNLGRPSNGDTIVQVNGRGFGQVNPVPEPTSMLALGGLTLAFLRRRGRQIV